MTTNNGELKIQLDWDLISRLAEIQCTEDEIAFACKCSTQTLRNHCTRTQACIFGDYLETNRAGGKASLRRMQWKSAEGQEGELLKDEKGNIVRDEKGRPQWKVLPLEPNITMQIWLGKQYLGQSDKQEIGGKDNKPIEILVRWDGNRYEANSTSETATPTPS